MRQVTYAEYLRNPKVREQLELEARRARSQLVHALIVGLMSNVAPRRMPSVQLKTA